MMWQICHPGSFVVLVSKNTPKRGILILINLVFTALVS